MGKVRVVPPVIAPVLTVWRAPGRVSNRRHGVTGMYRNPVAAETVMLALVPVIAADATSVAVIVLAPNVTNTAENVPAPLISVVLGGSTAEGSELVKCTWPG